MKRIIRCDVTGNPCGTDTTIADRGCTCLMCEIHREIANLRAALFRVWSEHRSGCITEDCLKQVRAALREGGK